MTRNPNFEVRTKYVMSNVTLFYPKVFRDHLDEYEGKERYKVTLALEPEKAAKMEDQGFNIKYDEDNNAFVDAFRNKMIKKNTKEMPPPIIKFADGTPYDVDVHGFIGNGTVADVHVNSVYTKVGKEVYLPMYLDEIHIIELVPYGGDAVDGDSVI